MPWKKNVFGSLLRRQAFSTSTNHFKAGMFLLPHHDKKHKGGEDAGVLNPTMLAVADGVGGWAQSGVDPAIYSRRLCALLESLYESKDDRYLASPRSLLVDAVDQNKEVGSCTICIVQLDEHAPVVTSCNLGDSGYMILRQHEQTKNLEIVYESKEQQHAFNFPFQVGTNGDSPEKGEVLPHTVHHNDILVLGSDGLWDNLHRAKVVEMINSRAQQGPDIHQHVDTLAQSIAQEAEAHSLRQRYMSPFAESAKAHGYQYQGGKPDDITVIVAQVALKPKESKASAN